MTNLALRLGRRVFFLTLYAIAAFALVSRAESQTVSVGPYQPSAPPLNASANYQNDYDATPVGASQPYGTQQYDGQGYGAVQGIGQNYVGLPTQTVPFDDGSQYGDQSYNFDSFSQDYYPGETLAPQTFADSYGNALPTANGQSQSVADGNASPLRSRRTAGEIWSTLLFGAPSSSSRSNANVTTQTPRSSFIRHHEHGNTGDLELNPILRFFTFSWLTGRGDSRRDNEPQPYDGQYFANADYPSEVSGYDVQGFSDGYGAANGYSAPYFDEFQAGVDQMNADLQSMRQDVSQHVREYSSRLADNIESQRRRAAQELHTAHQEASRAVRNSQRQTVAALQNAQRDISRAVDQSQRKLEQRVARVNQKAQRTATNVANAMPTPQRPLAARQQTRGGTATQSTPNRRPTFAANESNAAPQNSNQSGASKRRRLEELNAILAAKDPEEFARHIRQTNALTSQENVAPNARAEDASPEFNAARANRSKIRQASLSTPTPTTNQGTRSQSIPTRPKGVKISERVYLSSDVVELPTSGAQTSNAPSSTRRKTIARVKEPRTNSAITPQKLPTYKSTLDDDQEESLETPPTPLQESQPSSDADPTPIQNIRALEAESESNVLRSSADFVDPRNL